MINNNTLEKWENTTFSEEFIIKSGDFLSAQNMNLNGCYDVYGGNGINGKHDSYNYTGENIIIGRVGEKCGNVHYVNNDIWVTDNAFVLIDTEHSFDKRFLYYLLTELNLRQYATKSTHPVISGKSLKDVKIIFPISVCEQQRIVGILDEAFENIEKAKQNALQNLNNAKELFENTIEKLFTKDTEDWSERKLSELGVIYTGTTPKTSEKDNFGDFIPFIKPADFNKDGTLNYNNEGLSEKGLKKARFIPKYSVLMVCIGATITKTSFTTMDITCNQQINTLTPNKDDYKFVYYAMIRKSFKDVIISGCPQTTLPIINKTNWSELKIKLPDINAQQKIVAQLDELQEQTKKLEQIYEQKLKDLDELKQSILQKAFNGEL